MKGADLPRLAALGLLLHPERLSGAETSLRALCAAGALNGGLSVALDVRPDELVGPLCQQVGGPAPSLRVLDVRTAPAELWVRVGDVEEHWPVPDLAALVDCLNSCYRAAPDARAIAQLGKWEDAQQLWCVGKPALVRLLEEGLLEAENAPALAALVRRRPLQEG